jgi:hypothetical protein
LHDYDAFLVKLNTDGALLWGSVFGGDSWDVVGDVTADAAGNIILVGFSTSSDWRATGFDTQLGAGRGGFAAKVREWPRPVVECTVPAPTRLRLAFEAARVERSELTVERAPALVPPGQWMPEPGAVIMSPAPGQFVAELPRPESTYFYRVRIGP